ncbi:MAG: hypothetical protein KAH01_02880 [Caldisericia bacterium]|nr:hypothetical protein [Caldisericia bacterium]
MISKKYKNEKGSTTLEFALLFPFSFLLTFFALVIIFRSADALLITYETNRVARAMAMNGSVSTQLTNQVQGMPMLNQYQTRVVTAKNTDAPLIKAQVQMSNGLIPKYFLTLTLEDDAVDQIDQYSVIRERAVYVDGF